MMARQFGVAAVVCALAVPYHAVAQPTTIPVPDGGVSVVMRCKDCGVVNSIREIQQPRQGGLPNLPSESPIGLVMYIPLGRGAKETGTYAGSVGSREWQQRTISTRYEFTVRMDDGDYRSAQKDGVSDLQVGDRVRLSDGKIERWGQ
jgi:outer membrane lipoprotein SlyB